MAELFTNAFQPNKVITYPTDMRGAIMQGDNNHTVYIPHILRQSLLTRQGSGRCRVLIGPDTGIRAKMAA